LICSDQIAKFSQNSPGPGCVCDGPDAATASARAWRGPDLGQGANILRAQGNQFVDDTSADVAGGAGHKDGHNRR